MVEYKPFLNFGPGEFIKEELEVRNWRQEDLSEIIGMSYKSINQIIKNKQPITIDTARLLSKAFGQSPQYWTNLDTNYRLRLKEEDPKSKSIELKSNIYRHMPITEMKRKGWIKPFISIEQLSSQVKKFWGIKKIDFSFQDKTSLLNFRKSKAYNSYNNYYALTWSRMAKLCSNKYYVPGYSKDGLLEIVEKLPDYTLQNIGIEIFLDDLNKVGVKFFVLSHLQNTYLDGSAFLDSRNPVIVYTKRYDRVDNFWFTMAHEIAHVVLHLKNKNNVFLDDLDIEGSETVEIEANEYASNYLKVEQILEYFKPFEKYVSEYRVLSCSEELKICPSLIVGVLKHYKILSWNRLNQFKIAVSDFIPKKFFVESIVDD